jgi:uncharacterized protein YbdZ (MbtH family)
VTSQFEYLDASYVVLVNDAGQRSLWPGFADAPDCWRVVFGKAGREEYLSFIEESRHDMRPKSLIEAMGNKGAATGGTSA